MYSKVFKFQIYNIGVFSLQNDSLNQKIKVDLIDTSNLLNT